jgi:hypothetical protein
MLITVHSHSFDNKISWVFSALLLALGFVLFLPAMHKVSAFTPNYNPSNLIDNPTLLNTSTMSPQAIQTFLSNEGSGITSLTDVEACDSNMTAWYGHCGQTVSAAQIIYDAGQAYGVNPRAILATLEKEESLVTDPSPNSSQINCAMGYASCNSNYLGFFTQVDWGTFTLRYNYEGAMQHSNWLIFHPAANYPCRNAQPEFYSNALFPGNTVTFADSGGTSETITIANAATATLYCYTPYVGPYWVTGYSGSYNFVYYYQLWFGTTQASSAYAWSNEGSTAYSDTGYSQPLTNGIYIAPSQKAYLTIDARNVGYNDWSQSVVHLGTSVPIDRQSVFSDSSWLSSNRIVMQQSSVSPGEDAKFKFSVTAPSTPGTYVEKFNLVADGISWMTDQGLYIVINVVQPGQVNNNQNTGLNSGQILNVGRHLTSPESQSTLALLSSGNLILVSDGQVTWSNGVNNSNASYLVLQSSDGNLVEYDKNNQPLWGAAGSPGDHLALQTDGNVVIYSSGGSGLWSTASAGNPNYLNRFDQCISNGAAIYGGQILQTADSEYTLSAQTDGNFVEYVQGKPIWSTKTAGNSSANVVMQNDGNLVVYSSSGKALWATDTFGSGNMFCLQPTGVPTVETPNGGTILWPGEKLVDGQIIATPNYSYSLAMQNDGNLVIYNYQGNPVWGSGTQGHAGDFLAVQPDGNVVIYSSSGNALWSTRSAGQGNINLVMQSDGNLVLYNNKGAVWGSR